MRSPYLEQRGKTKLLMVKEQPFIMLGGEVHNSNSSTAAAMRLSWEKARALGMNALYLPVCWDQLEPEEGRFDFSVVDERIREARERDMKIGFLWFGAWKNAQCYYAPAWVKTDLARFRRAQVVKGENKSRLASFHGMEYTSLSYLCEETKRADAKAFAALMAHIREVDEKEQTVIWMQVENETGVMGAAREVSDEADAAFAQAAPQDFANYMRSHAETMEEDLRLCVENGKKSGSWAEVFGACAEEVFSAYHIASHVNEVAAAGRRAYDLPLSVNCWLDQGGGPGAYPSGGPIRRMLEVWKYCAPEIDVYAPDIYVPDYCGVCDRYTVFGNPLAIAETATHGYCAPRMVYSVGHYHAACYSPFGFEELGEPFGAAQGFLFGIDVTDPMLKTPQDAEEYAWYTKNLRSMTPLLAERYGTEDLQAVCREAGTDVMVFGTYGFRAVMDDRASQMFGGRTDGVCLALRESEDTFYVMLSGCVLAPFSADPERPAVDFLDLEEGYFAEGKWIVTRRRNGDEAAILTFDRPTLLRVRLFAYR